MQTRQEELNQYSVLAIEVIHELQQMVDKQRAEISEGLERERQLLHTAGQMKTMIEQLQGEVVRQREINGRLREEA